MYPMWRPYVPVARRRLDAAREMLALRKKGIAVSPIVIQGKTIATTVWGKAWCTHLERYSDYANRLPRGRTYVRNGSVVDLQISAGTIMARVQGSRLYTIKISVSKMGRAEWKKLCDVCAGGIDSLVGLLQGRFSAGVMERLCHHTEGMFPGPRQIKLDCSCPDDAYLCKHLAAVLYGIGARLDHQPELLFLLRQVDASELLTTSGAGLTGLPKATATDRVLVADDMAALFGLELDEKDEKSATVPSKARRAGRTPPPAVRVPARGRTAAKRSTTITIKVPRTILPKRPKRSR